MGPILASGIRTDGKKHGEMSDDASIILASPAVLMAFACENISQDPQGRVSFLNVIDSLVAATFPATTPILYLVFGFQSPTGAGMFVAPRIEIVAKGGGIIATQPLPQDIPFSPSHPSARIITGMNGVTWPQADDYIVKFMANNQVKASFQIRITQAATQ